MAGITFTVGAGVADSAFGLVQAPIQMLITKEAELYEEQSMLKKLFREVNSSHAMEGYAAMTSMGGPKPVGENGAYPSASYQESYQKVLKNVTWKNEFSVSAEAIEDNQNLDLQGNPEAFVAAHYRTKEEYGAAVYAGAMSGKTAVDFEGISFDIAGADGKCLFDTAHPSILKKKAQSNKFANEFSNKALVAAETAMQHFVDDNGKLLHIRPDTILIPNNNILKYQVLEAIGADKDPETNANGFNMNYGRWNVIGWTYLDQFLEEGAMPWVLLDSTRIQKGRCAIWQQRKKMAVHSYIDNGTDANVWHDRSRFVAGFADWRFASIGGMTGGTELKLA